MKKAAVTSLIEVTAAFLNFFSKNIKNHQKGIIVPVIIRHFLLCLKQKGGEHYEIKKDKSTVGSQKIC